MPKVDDQTTFDKAQKDDRTLERAMLDMVRKYPQSNAVSDLSGSLTRVKLAGIALALQPCLRLVYLEYDKIDLAGAPLPKNTSQIRAGLL